MRKICMIILGALLMVLLAACASADIEADAAVTLQVINLFEAADPEITVLGEPNGGTPDHFQVIDTQFGR